MSTDFKMSFVVAGQIKWTCIYLEKKITEGIEMGAPGCLAAVNKSLYLYLGC